MAPAFVFSTTAHYTPWCSCTQCTRSAHDERGSAAQPTHPTVPRHPSQREAVLKHGHNASWCRCIRTSGRPSLANSPPYAAAGRKLSSATAS